MTSTLPISFSITHITASSAILHIDGINFITDPVFSPAGKEWDMGPTVLKNTKGPALKLRDLPVIDFVLLSHEDHPDNLDELGRRHLDDRRVLTAQDGARKLAPRPGVTGMPRQNLPGCGVIGFVVKEVTFGEINGLPNVICISSDTVAASDPPLLVTMDGKQAARLFREIGADILVPMHYEFWEQFAEKEDQLRVVFEQGDVSDQVRWLELGAEIKIFQ
ncbi:hypothetical protein HER10_EVM0012656 [Colletotrichum scovillei]|uniref:uncharacterized protein n=1 Tax=Colletotrichum scovillei TaxID=1209932 RepID=UPI0015C33496|nr:uncharacterized protein HER10_EVM0012656 [Colletotrichum scovillei]KAF4781490.1 hypothetical protein HER10_EVM0012656 [Colletotrichum scovillei]